MQFLVIGGAGYIGSHFIAEARRQGHSCVVYDNLSRGHRASIPDGVKLIEADILDGKKLQETLSSDSFDGIFHFAALALVGESVSDPDLYYENNGEGVRQLLNAMRAVQSQAGLVFSSSCAVFGTPQHLPMREADPKLPISPYGRSKLMAEWMIEDACRAYGLKAIALRYFNACGADPVAKIGEDHQPETHLIPNVLRSALTGQSLEIFGNDFPTQDGTCVRDYIHVTDLADAHIKAAKFLTKAAPCTYDAIHLGTGQGYSNLQVLQTVEKVLGRKLVYKIAARRAGDPAELYADSSKAKELLGFETRYSDLTTIIQSALAWHKACPKGYG
ncbi:MAG: UDP-glucose 4-epimerase GalE [Proteobacteria bacterium]|nr:UDP-glucose 4-epimerase GalE [Pseudomonadota bacterium]